MFGDAVHQQPADAVGALEDGDQVPGAVERAAAASPAGPEPTTATRLPSAGPRIGDDPAFLEAPIDDGALDCLDGDGGRMDAQDAGALAGAGADASGEFRKLLVLCSRPALRATDVR